MQVQFPASTTPSLRCPALAKQGRQVGPWDGTALRPKWNAAVGEELYHHRGDTEPDIDVRFEQANLAGDDALVSTKAALREALLAQVRA